MTIKENIESIQNKILETTKKIGTQAPNIVAISKKHTDLEIKEALDAGISYIGESYIQEAIPKIETLNHQTWDFVGKIQTNKIKLILKYFNRIHALSKLKHLEKINQVAKDLNKKPDIFIQVNLAGEDTKGGIETYKDLKDLVFSILSIEEKHFNLLGLMAIPPFTKNPEDSRKYFKKLKQYMLDLNKDLKINLNRLSMGMTNDFIIAIEEGSTDLRIGTGIFGVRI